MIRGTTPTHVFELPEDLVGMIKALRIIYKQGGNIVLKKEAEDVEINGAEVSYRLTQEEALSFQDNIAVRIQLRIRTLGDDLVSHKPVTVDVEELLDDEVL